MHKKTKKKIERLFNDILEHSMPLYCERCRFLTECFNGVNKETVHQNDRCWYRSWDKDAEFNKLKKIFKDDK